jgi:hypothetical protein
MIHWLPFYFFFLLYTFFTFHPSLQLNMNNCSSKKRVFDSLKMFFEHNGKSETKQSFATKPKYNEKAETKSQKSKTLPSWSLKKLCRSFKGSLSKKKNQQHKEDPIESIITAFPQLPSPHSFQETGSSQEEASNDHIEVTNNCCGNASDTYEKDIVPLRQFLRYSMDRSDRRTFQRRRMARPFEPKYEIEWQKNQWLQLDRSTNQEIEHLRRNGFTRIAVRKDACLKKHITYDNPSDIDVLLELSLYTSHEKCANQVDKEPEPIVCHQPSSFSIRRTQWWHTEYKIGEAHLPNWVDADLCCNAVIMDAPSVLLAMTNYSRSSLSSAQQLKLPDTPSISQKSSIMHLQKREESLHFKPLQYAEPPILMLDTCA